MATADPNDPDVTPDMVDPTAPASVIIRSKARPPNEDPTVGIPVSPPDGSDAENRLVVIGDSIAHGFQSNAIFNTDISWPSIVAWEMGWDDHFRFPKYQGFGGLPLNIEYLIRILESEYGRRLSAGEFVQALFRLRSEMDKIEDWWERGGGTSIPNVAGINHNLAIYGWDVRDALARTFKVCQDGIKKPKDDLLSQMVEDANDRAALRVLPQKPNSLSAVAAAAALGKDGGIETLVVGLGANNALGSVVSLEPKWSQERPVKAGVPAYQDLDAKKAFNVWDPDHFKVEWDALINEIEAIDAKHVIVATVPHVTVAPIARGVGRDKLRIGSRYFPYYTRPWINDSSFNRHDDPYITGVQARAIDSAIDQYNECIVASVKRQRQAGKDWYVLEICGLLDGLAQRRYIEDSNARPPWWTQYELPGVLKSLKPPPDSHFFSSDETGRLQGGLFALDGVHPTTIGYGIIAQEVIKIMQMAGVQFYFGNTPTSAIGTATKRVGPVAVDFQRLVDRDSLVSKPPKNLANAVEIIGWLDEKLDWVKRMARNLT
jgi:hypothetical protein